MYVFILSPRKKIIFSLQVEFSTLWKAEKIFKVLLVKANFLSVLQLAIRAFLSTSSHLHDFLHDFFSRQLSLPFVFFKLFPESGVEIACVGTRTRDHAKSTTAYVENR